MVYTLDEIAQRVRPVAEKYHLRAVYVFGSYARGEAREESDVDLLIDDTDSGLRDLEEALEKEISFILVGSLEGPCRVKSDIYFRENVNRERRRIYAAA